MGGSSTTELGSFLKSHSRLFFGSQRRIPEQDPDRFQWDGAVNRKETFIPMAPQLLVLVEGSKGDGLIYVQAARRLGLHPITLAADPSQYDYLAAESVDAIQVDTNDLDALKRACSGLRAAHDIGGVVCFSSREGTVAELCRYFGLPLPDLALIHRHTDEFSQCGILAQDCLPIPGGRVARNATEAESAGAEFGMPVVGPVSGSSGAELCRIVEEVAEHTSNVLRGTHVWQAPPQVRVEELEQRPYDTAGIIAAAPHRHQTERADFAPDVAAIATAIAGVTAFAIAQGLTFPLISLVLEQHGVSPTISGLNFGVYAAGLGSATVAVGRLTHLVRGDYLIVLGLIGCASSLATLAAFDPLWIWFVARFALGFCTGIIFILSEGPSFVPTSPLALRGISRRSEDLARAIESDPARPHKYENPSLSDGRGSQLETTGECFSVNFAVRVQPRSHQFSPTFPQARKSFWNRLVGGFRIAPPTIGSSTAPPGNVAMSR